MWDRIGQALLLLFFVVLVALKKIGTSDDVTNGGIVIAGLLCFVFVLFNGKKTIVKTLFKYGVAMSVFFCACFIYNSNAHFINILWIWAFIGVAGLYFEKGLNKKILLTIFLVYSVVTIYELVFLGRAAAEITNTGSSNSVSAQSIFLLSFYYLSKYREENNTTIDYWPVFLIAIISVLTATRSSLVALAFFMISAVYFNIRDSRHKSITIVILCFSILAAVYLFINYFDTYGTAFEDKTERLGLESARSDIWSDYFKGCLDSFANFFLGVPGSDATYRYLHEYAGNTHNSFLMLHSKFGICGLSLFVYIIIKSITSAIRRKQHFIICVTILVLVRCSFDWIAFPGYYDVYFWFLVLYLKYGKSKMMFLYNK